MNRTGVSSSAEPSKVNSREETPEQGNEPRSENSTHPASRSRSAQVARTPPDPGGRRSEGTGACPVLETIFAVGRGWMESILSESAPEEPAPSQRMGSCGHPQQLEGYRPKQVLTLLGKVTFRRAYYRCVVAEDRAESRERGAGEADASTQQAGTHGEAPADERWGLQGQRTSAGVQQAVSYLCASLTLEEAAETERPAAPLTDVSASSSQLDAAAGRSPAAAGR